MFGGEEVVSAFAFDVRHYATCVVVAEEAMQNWWLIEACNYEATNVGDQRDEGRSILVRGGARAIRRARETGASSCTRIIKVGRIG